MTNYNHSPENLVEINLTCDCCCFVPCKGSDGTLSFEEVYPTGDIYHAVEGVKVPTEATTSKEALQEYLSHQQEYSFSSSVDLSNANIFDENIGKYGDFRFA